MGASLWNSELWKRNRGLRVPSTSSAAEADWATSPAANTARSSLFMNCAPSSGRCLRKSSTASEGHHGLSTYRTPMCCSTYGSMDRLREYTAHGNGSMAGF